MNRLPSLPALLAAAVLVLAPATGSAQKALVYCPTGESDGCATIAAALASTGAYPGGVERAYDGSSGTVDLRTADLFQYGVLVVPSLSDDAGSQPYALLRDAAVAERLRLALLGRRAFYSGTPDQGATSRMAKDALIANLAAWAAANYATVRGPGLVALQDASDDETRQYDWVTGLTGLRLTTDWMPATYNGVRTLTATGMAILASGGTQLAYDNMASFGFYFPNGAPGISMDAVGQTGTAIGGNVVLVTAEGANVGGAWVKTDRNDYAPGTTVVMSGGGFQAWETITITLHEDPLVHDDRTFTTTADASGGFTFTGFAPEAHDIGVRFVLTAVGRESGRRAQTTFTDAPGDVATITSPAFTRWVGACSPGITIRTDNPTGTPTTTGNKTVTLTPGSGGSFHTLSDCSGSAVTSVTIPPGSSTTTVYYKNSSIGTVTIAASFGSSTNQTETIVPKIAFTNAAPNVSTGVCTALTLQLQNSSGNAITRSTPVTIGLSSTSAGGSFHSNSGCGGGPNTITSVTLSVGATGSTTSTVGVFYKDGNAGSPTLTATDQSTTVPMNSVSQTATITASVATTTSVASSQNPSVSGQSVTFTATVAPQTGTTVPTGSVSFSIDGAPPLAGSALATSGSTATSTLAAPSLAVGAHTVVATYSATGSFTGSSNAAAPLAQTVNKANAVVVLTSSLNPSVFGQSVTLTAAVTAAAPGAGTPSGTVTFKNGATVLCSAAALTSGQATCATSALPANTSGHSITAEYSGDGNFNTNTSSALSQVVNKVSTSVAGITASTSTYGGTTNLSATVAPAGVAGSVAFYLNGSATPVAGTYDAATGVATASGHPHGLDASATAYSVRAVFTSASPNHDGSEATNPSGLTVNKAAATIALGSLSHTYDGTPKAATATTTPPGLTGVSLVYKQSATVVAAADVKNAGSYTVEASLSNANYALAPANDPTTGTLVIGKATPTVAFTSAAPATLAYGGTYTPAATTTGDGALTLGATGACSIGGGVVTMNAGSGTCTVTAAAAEGTNYLGASATPQTIAATKAAQAAVTVTGMPATAQTFGTTFTVGGSGGSGTGAYSFEATGACSVNASTGAAEMTSGIGSCSITATRAGDGNYLVSAASAPATVAAAKATQAAVTLTQPASGTFGQKYDLNGAGGSTTGTITYSLNGSDACVIGTDGKLEITKGSGGTCSVTATRPGNDNYNPASSAPLSVTLQKATPTVGATGGSFTYDGTAKAGSGTATGVAGANLTPVALSYAGVSPTVYPASTTAPTGAGTYTVTASFAGDANYSSGLSAAVALTIAKANQTITFGALADRTYGDGPVTLGATAPGGVVSYALGAASVGCSVSGSTVTITGAATGTDKCVIVASQAGNANYEAAPPVTQSFGIAKATPTVSVSWTGGTFGASNAASGSVTGVGGASLGTPTFSYEGVSPTSYGPSATVPTNAGSYKVTASYTGNGNYEPAANTAATSIGKAASTTVVTVSSPVFNGSPQGGTAQVTGAGGLSQSLTVSYSGRNGTAYGPSNTAPTNAGDYTASATYAESANHLGSTDSKNFSITKATPTVVATGGSFTYDATPKAGSGTATGVGGASDVLSPAVTLSYAGVSPTSYGPSATAPTGAGRYTVTATFAGNTNYLNRASEPVSLTIRQAAATVEYTGPVTISGTSGKNGTGFSATVTSSATVQVTVGTIGTDLRVEFKADNGGAGCTATVGSIGGDGRTGTATCTWQAQSNTDQGVAYGITTSLLASNYSATPDIDVVNVSAPGTSFITGGGHLILGSNSAGTLAGTAGTKSNFGFNVKYNKSATNLQGNVNIVFRRRESDGILHVYQVKGNAMTQLSSTTTSVGGKATFNGKANLQDITNPAAPVSMGGNLVLQLDLTDNGEPGTGDTIGIMVTDGSSGSLVFSSAWSGTRTVEQVLRGGNLVVR